MFKRILVPLDGSRFAEVVLPLVEEQAARVGGKVTLIHVITASRGMLPSSRPVTYGARVVVNSFELASASIKEYLEGVSEGLVSKGIAVDWVIQQGVAAGELIVKYAREKEIDLIIIATHGRGWLGRFLSGSTTDYLLRRSGLPILAVRPAERAAHMQDVRQHPVGA